MKYQTLIRTTATFYLLMAVLGCTGKESKEGFLHVDKKVISIAKTATESRFTVSSTQHWQLNKPNTGAEWITNIAADNGTSDASSITGENDAFITITTTANPSSAGRSTRLTLRAIDQAGKALTDPTPVTISFTQSGTAHTGDVSVTTQAQVDELRTSLTAGATRIVGNVTIGPKSGTSNISDLSPLAAITEITGNVLVQNNPDLPNLMGLNQLQSIGGSFVVGSNPILTSLGVFPDLQTIGGSFVVRYNASLISLRGFPMLTHIGSADGVYVPSTDSEQDGGEQNDVSIVIEENYRLQDCCVLTAFLSGATNAVSGEVFIGNNDPGCSSTTQVNCGPFLQVGQKVVFATKTAGEGTLEIFSRGRWQLSKPNTGAEWITNIAVAGGRNSDASSITGTGENHAFITITTTANPNDAGRSTILTLRAIDQAEKALTNPAPITILFTQLGTAHVGDVTLHSQADVNALTFPANATTIQGNLIIGNYNSNSDITDLRPLSGITHVTGGVAVWGNDRLVSLSPLGNLQAIGGNFSVGDNNLLQDCCVLKAFLSGATNAISGKVFINNNDPGCNSITQVNCDPFLQVGQKVVFAAKTATEGRIDLFSRGYWQFSKPNTGAEWITSIVADNGTSDASSITGENNAFITITTTANPNNAGRSTTLTLRAIDQAGKALTDPAPVTISFTQLGTAHVGDVTLHSQVDVNALTLPANVTAIQGNLIIRGSDDITDLRPLSGITHVTGRIEVVRNDKLVSLGPLGNLQSIGGGFEVGGDSNMGEGNASLPSLGNFPALQSIGGHFRVSNNYALTSLGDFPVLQSIGGYFEVEGNALTSLGGFPMLASIGSTRVLVSSIESVEDDVSIVVEGNGWLQDCCVLTEFLRDGTNAVSGQIFIKYNGTGCNSTTEVNCDSFLQVGQKVVFSAKTVGEGTLDLFSRQHWQLNKPNTGAEWITNIAAGGGNSDASSITGENHAFITITTTANPSNAGRSTTLTLRAIDQTGNALTDPPPVTIPFTQLGTTHTGDITLKSQADVNAFPANVTAIQGDLIIRNLYSNSDITDLRPLSGITHVTGSVEVVRNDRLVSLSPLGNLQSIGDIFEVSSNASLTSLGDFTALQTIGGRFYVSSNDALTSLGNFPALQTIGDGFYVSSNEVLTSLRNFTALQTIGDDFRVGDNEALTSLGGFLALQFIGGVFEVRDNATLISLGDFSALQSIGGGFVVGGYNGGGNAALTSLGDFSTLQSIGGGFVVDYNDALTSLGGFSALQTIGGGFVVGGYSGGGNASLISLGDFPVLQTIGGRFVVYDNDALTSLGDFPVLQTIGVRFVVYDNDALTSLGRFPMLEQGGVSIKVEDNGRLQDCCVLTTLLSGGTNAVSREVSINNNATGCNNKAKIKPCEGGSTTKGK